MIEGREFNQKGSHNNKTSGVWILEIYQISLCYNKAGIMTIPSEIENINRDINTGDELTS